MNQLPGILLVAPKSGSGEKMITCGIMECLQQRGAEFVYFSLAADSALPAQVDGLILPSEDSEQYAKEMEQNESLRNAIKCACENGLPCLVEGGETLCFSDDSHRQAIDHFLLKCQSYRAGRLAKAHWDAIAKPIDSLGLLEDYIVKISRITGSAEPYALDRRALAIFCADHGVVEEGVTQTGQEVTGIVSENFAKGCSTVNILAEKAGTDVYAIDVGMNTDTYPEKRLVMGHVIDRKVMRGSRNLAKEAAMTIEECEQAIAVGRQVVRDLKEMDYKIIALGEMGIGNTTPTSALASIFLKKSAEEVTGKGAGLSSEGIRKKCRVVEQAVRRVEEKGLQDPIAILAEVGGLEIAAMTGAFLGGMENRIPMVIDGAIAAVAALTACRIDSGVKDYLLASHVSEEPVGRLALEDMGLEALLHGRMCLGEGTGAVALFPLLDMATEVYRRMGSFEDYAIEAYERFEE